jgi:hypothetical protein
MDNGLSLYGKDYAVAEPAKPTLEETLLRQVVSERSEIVNLRRNAYDGYLNVGHPTFTREEVGEAKIRLHEAAVAEALAKLELERFLKRT